MGKLIVVYCVIVYVLEICMCYYLLFYYFKSVYVESQIIHILKKKLNNSNKKNKILNNYLVL